jgi:tol-pal system protein YbgF
MMLSIQTLRSSLIAGAACVALLMAGPAAAQEPAELLLRIDRLENLVRQLNGQVEQAQNQNRRLDEQLKRFQGDTDFRFKELEGGRGGRPAAPAPGAQPPTGQPPAGQPPRQQRGDAFDPTANPQAAGTPQPLGSPGSATQARRPAGSDVVANPGQIIAGQENAIGRDPRQPTDLSPQPRNQQTASIPTAPGTPKGEIDLGRQQLRDGQYDTAEQTFREFTRARPKDRLMPDALIGLGDSYFQRQRWREAAEQFVDLTTKYPKSVRAAEAELKLGISLRGLGAAKEACDILNNHGQKYPAASTGIKQGVQRELQRARCGG